MQPRTSALLRGERAVHQRARVDDCVVKVKDEEPLPRPRLVDDLKSGRGLVSLKLNCTKGLNTYVDLKVGRLLLDLPDVPGILSKSRVECEG